MNTSPFVILVILLITPLTALYAADAPQRAAKPNIVLILADDK